MPDSSNFSRILALSLGCAAVAGEVTRRPMSPPRPVHEAPASTGLAQQGKIDPALRSLLADGSPRRVLILGRRQLLAQVGGLDAFARQHAGADRRVLRREVLDSLAAIAIADQASLLRALGRDRAALSLWIVNGMILSLTPAEIEHAAALDAVAYVYSAPAPLPPAPSTSAAAIPLVADTPRPPFDLREKRIPWYVERLGAPRVWTELGVHGEGVVIASLDAGVNYRHEDLRGALWRNPGEHPNNGRDDDGNGWIDDIYGFDFARMRPDVMASGDSPVSQHGTVTAGIALGDGAGGLVTGIAPRARLMVLRGYAGVAQAALSYQYALAEGADILSMSFTDLSAGQSRGLWRMMSDHAVAAGMVLVGGAGNFRQSATIPYQHGAPKDAPSVISVGGVDASLQRTSFSSGGPVEWQSIAGYGDFAMPLGLIKPDVVAFPGPGYPLISLSSDSGYLDPNRSVAGNSLSGPQGAGAAALVLSAEPATPAWRVREILEATARDLGTPGKDNEFGAGLIDLYRAVLLARESRP